MLRGTYLILLMSIHFLNLISLKATMTHRCFIQLLLLFSVLPISMASSKFNFKYLKNKNPQKEPFFHFDFGPLVVSYLMNSTRVFYSAN